MAELDRFDHGGLEAVPLVRAHRAGGLAAGHHARLERERDEALLHTVVQVTFQSAAGPVL